MTVIDHPSPNSDARDRAVALVVLHYTGMATGKAALARLCDVAPIAIRYPGPWQPADIDPNHALGRVSAHYVVEEDGRVFRLVDEKRRAWHAGASSWQGEEGVNARSIGIEIVNGGHDFGLPDFPEAQIGAVVALLQDILTRHALQPEAVIGHSDIAPARKLDPGEKFPWAKLAAAGVSIWPRRVIPPGGQVVGEPGEAGAGVVQLQKAFAAFGYGIALSGTYDAQTEAVVSAFQRRFRPARIDGVCDAETLDCLADLNDQLGLGDAPPVEA
ncbi:MAG: N-acetylmuramoyl-L-alanine amidase [Alphaproteobacteria bacterium]|nr:N-acetylmuramoyl-L-alanine amidase [Alphaproteobacteria bacterium]